MCKKKIGLRINKFHMLWSIQLLLKIFNIDFLNEERFNLKNFKLYTINMTKMTIFLRKFGSKL